MRRLTTLASSASRLADHDAESLGRWLAACTHARPDALAVARGRRAARRAFRHAWSRDEQGDAAWNDEALCDAGIGRWARPALLTLQPATSLSLAQRATSSDGCERLLLRAADGALVESVIIPAEAGRDRARTTLCVSSQVGCARGCTFCETGVLGLDRQLTSGEMVDQVRVARRLCVAADRPVDRRGAGSQRASSPARSPAEMSNLVFMGMGEPLDNLREVVRAIELLTDPHAFAFAPSRITVSTVGVADKFALFFASTRAELAVSLHAMDDERRSRIMPVNRRHGLAELRRALVDALPPGRRVLFQYVLFGGFNDAPADADALAAYARGIRCRINVLTANPGPDPTLVEPTRERVDAFVGRLRSHGVTTTVRLPRGRDVGGACGQLAGRARGGSEQPSWP